MVSLIEVAEDADVNLLLAASRQAIADEPAVIRGEIESSLGLLKDAVPHADYSLILDFEDEEAMKRYLLGAPHAALAALVDPLVSRVMITQYLIGDARS
jgi:hypothetical protein